MSKKEASELARRQEESKRAKERRMQKVCWHYLTRNQKEVAKRITAGDYRMIRGAGWGFLDRFIIFLKTVGYLKILDVEGKGYSRKMITVAKLLLTYNVKILMGISSMNQVPEMLFGDVGLLMLLGFTAEQIKSGHCSRGKGKSNKPMHKDTLADMLDRFTPQEMERILNTGVKLLVKCGFIKDDIYIMDDSMLETTEKCKGCGSKTVKEKHVNKKGEIEEIEVTKYGFKLLIIRAVRSRNIVAAKVIKINEDARNYAFKLLKQAIKNIGEGKMKILLVDRGFIDGQLLWQIKHTLKINFIIPLKTDMHITSDARGFRNMQDNERIFREKRENIHVVGIKGLTTYDQYGDAKHNSKNAHEPDFKGNPVNAVMVTKWGAKEYGAGKEKVFLTTLPINRPLDIIDKYDLRSLIENTSFRELKQGWLINRVQKKTKNGITSHAILTLCMYNMTCAYRTELGQNLADKGMRRWRLETVSHTRDKVVVIAGEYYGIFDLEEIMILSGNPPKEFWGTDPDKFMKDYGLIEGDT